MHITFIDSLQHCNSCDWNRLWQHTCADGYPFLRYQFLAALEDSNSVSSEQGWQPHHLIMHNSDGQLVAALPLYIKSHSWGEYVFDFVWAEAYQRAGLDYYPKLVNAVPFTPCKGPRLLHCESLQTDALWPQISTALDLECRRLKLSGWHSLFLPESNSTQLTKSYPQRLGCQFHWLNRDYRSFADFLAQMTSRKRKTINKERRQIAAQGITFRIKSGVDINSKDWQLFHNFYQLTYAKRSGHGGYLSGEFFAALGTDMAESIVLVCAYNNSGECIAAALNLRSNNCLFGRYWGCLAEYNFLHFETCYYQGIDYAIAEGLTRFDAGAQGEHKIARGFEPVLTYSNHSIVEPRFQPAVKEFVQREANDIQGYQRDACNFLPFKN